MWGSAIRWIAGNLAGIGIGYTFSDLFNYFTSPEPTPTEAQADQSETKSAVKQPSANRPSWLVQQLKDFFGLPAWFAPVVAIIIIVGIARFFNLFGKR